MIPVSAIKTVLIVDDHELLLSGLERAFRDFYVITATNRRDALASFELHPVQLAVVDLFLGEGESGLDIVRSMRAQRSRDELAIVMMSGLASVKSTVRALRAGADSLVEKPTTCAAILHEIGANAGEPSPPPTLAEREAHYIGEVMHLTNNNLSRAARHLGIHRQSLQKKLRKSGVPPQR